MVPRRLFNFRMQWENNGTVDIRTMRCLFALREFSNVLAEKGVEAARQAIPHDEEASRYANAVLGGREKRRKMVKADRVAGIS